jgi:hypothetical protein
VTVLAGLAVGVPSEAKVNPLVVIERQLHKANMLIVLDTSGSMTGVPGGTFTSASEVGVDCDNGDHCRQGVAGACHLWHRTCLSDNDCRHGYCQNDGVTACSTDADCPQDSRKCSATGTPCTDNSQCLPQNGTCALTGGTCRLNGTDCPAAGHCKRTQLVCTNPGSACADVGQCAHATSTTCTSPADCPLLTSGTCSVGGRTCSRDGDCPGLKHCQGNATSCSADTDCGGTCFGSHSYCDTKTKCRGNDLCVLSSACVSGDNVCVLPQDTCAKVDNTCVAANNTCNVTANTCVTPPANTCIPPRSQNDRCDANASGVSVPLGMCRIAQTVCLSDSDCPTSGDSCGPATSRAVVAKRAVTSIVNNNHAMLNFGLMTFYQNGYFPYFLTTGSPTVTLTYFARINKIANSHCWDDHTGPALHCTIDGVPMTLRSSGNSRYRVRTNPSVWITVDNNWCGHTCDMPGDLGLGHFEGAYYQYQGPSGGNSTTKIVQPTYQGPTITVGGKTYTYYQPLTNYYNGGDPPPLDFPDCGNACSATCGGRWDTQLAPFLSTADDPVISEANADAIASAMAPAASGGLIFYWGTPTGCTLQNDVAPTIHTSAYAYMNAVEHGNGADIPPDHVACRDNHVLLITDGEASGPGDTNCDSDKCAADDPVGAGCTCRSVLAAYHLFHDLGVKTFVVGFSGDSNDASARLTNDNIARAGGTDNGNDQVPPYAYVAQNEDQLNNALEMVIYNAVRGSYSTAPTSTSAGTQQSLTVAEGRYALDSRMDFPEWKGHLFAYDLSGQTPTLAWDASKKMDAGNWWQRRIYTWDGTAMVKIAVDPTTHEITNASQLATMGMGATATEAASVARWLLGDPIYANPAVLGAIINSTPIDIAGPGDVQEPGGHAFYLQHLNRPHLIYVGASDDLLHAFFLESTTLGSTTYQAGSEAFAFLPPDLIATVRTLYGQGGQKPDPYTHLFGLANSPKAKTLCIRNCDNADTAVWKTLLVMPEGYGGSDTFVLDVTDPFTAAGVADPPVTVQWHSGYGPSAAAYDAVLGNTLSLPAFYFNKTSGMNDYRLIFTSGYAVTDGSTTQGRALVTASVGSGAIQSTSALAPTVSCAQEYAALTDVATARDFARGQDSKLVAAYFGDTSGQLFRYTQGGGVTVDQALSCDHPLHFSPTVVQLDRDSYTTPHAHEIYPVQVTNSNMDLDTDKLPPSKMMFWKEVAHTDAAGNVTSVSTDTTWGQGGAMTLTVGNGNDICGDTTMDLQRRITCRSPLPTNARPTSTPLGVLLKDASGFEVMTTWYAPATDGCSRGESYLTIHQVTAAGTGAVTQRLGLAVASEPVTSPVILGGHLYVFGSNGPLDITMKVPDSLSPGRSAPPAATGSTFFRSNWAEIP